MSEISEEKKQELLELLSKQGKAKIKWVSTITQIQEEVITNSALELGLHIDGDSVSIMFPEKILATKPPVDELEPKIAMQKPEKSDSLKRVFRPGLLGAMQCGLVRFYWTTPFSLGTVVGIVTLIICFPFLLFFIFQLSIAFIIFIPFFIIGLIISIPYKFTFHPDYFEFRKWFRTTKVFYKDIQSITFDKRQVYVRVSKYRRELRDRHIILHLTTISGIINMNLFMYDYADGNSIKNRLIIRTAEINKNLIAQQIIY